jgi:hypothetical protein
MPWMEDEKRSSKPSHSWGAVGRSGWPYQGALPCHVIIELFRPFRGHIRGGANHGGTRPQTLGKGRGGGMGPAAALRANGRQMCSHQPAQQKGPAKGRQNFRALPHSAWMAKGDRVVGRVKGSRGRVARMGKSMDRQKNFRCLGYGSVRRGKSQGQKQHDAATALRWWHARRGTQLQSVAGTAPPGPPLTRTSRSSPSKKRTTGPHFSHFAPQRLGFPHAPEWRTG